MPTVAPRLVGLNSREFAQARKSMLLQGTVSQSYWERADERQRDILHNIELTVKSITEEDIETLPN